MKEKTETPDTHVVPYQKSLPSIITLTNEENFTNKQINEARTSNFEALIKQQYKQLYMISRDEFAFFSKAGSKDRFELLAEFDKISKELLNFNGWLEVKPKDDDSYGSLKYAKITLTPVYTETGLIYHFTGTLAWHNDAEKGREVPLGCTPTYGIPTGRIIQLSKTLASMGDSWIFDNAKVHYRTLDLKLTDE